MILLIGLPAIAFVIAFLYVWADGDGKIAAAVIGVVYAVIILFFTLIIVSVQSAEYIRNHSDDYTWYTEIEGTSYIKTLSDGNGNIQGSFFLGCGTISTSSKYYYYKYNSDSSFYMASIYTDGVKIIETDYRKPCIVKHVRHIDWSRSEFGSNWLLPVTTLITEYYEIYVPKNTIIMNYNLDAQ